MNEGYQKSAGVHLILRRYFLSVLDRIVRDPVRVLTDIFLSLLAGTFY